MIKKKKLILIFFEALSGKKINFESGEVSNLVHFVKSFFYIKKIFGP